jgi:hypothetical protein
MMILMIHDTIDYGEDEVINQVVNDTIDYDEDEVINQVEQLKIHAKIVGNLFH